MSHCKQQSKCRNRIETMFNIVWSSFFFLFFFHFCSLSFSVCAVIFLRLIKAIYILKGVWLIATFFDIHMRKMFTITSNSNHNQYNDVKSLILYRFFAIYLDISSILLSLSRFISFPLSICMYVCMFHSFLLFTLYDDTLFVTPDVSKNVQRTRIITVSTRQITWSFLIENKLFPHYELGI